MSSKDGGPAYPICDGYERESDHSDRGHEVGEPRYIPINPRGGMTLRQRYKMAAMAGLITLVNEVDDFGPKEVAYEAALYADAMLAEDEQHAKEQSDEG